MSVTVRDLVKNLQLEIIYEGNLEDRIVVSEINRPGLQLAGFYDYFDNKRVQVVGKTEWSYLNSLDSSTRRNRIEKFYSFENPCIIFTRSLEPPKEFLEVAAKYSTSILRSKSESTKVVSKITNYLESELAPETRMHGVLVDVYGIGILITGESGIGKSEAALELIKRGHRLIADDAVDIKEIDSSLHGTCPYITMGMLEVRGMGIIDVSAIYGSSCIVTNKKISLVISLVNWNEEGSYERLGLDKDFMDILGVKVEKIVIPIRPGRNIAVIIEAAAANYRYHATSNITPVETIEKRMEQESK